MTAEASAQPPQVHVQTIAGELLTSAPVTPGMACGAFRMQIAAVLLGSNALDNAQPVDVEDGAVLIVFRAMLPAKRCGPRHHH